MPYLLERHTVTDYAGWKQVFDGDADDRAAAGSSGAWIFRNAERPNELVVLFEWDNMENLRSRIESSELRSKMQEAGVSNDTEFVLLEEIEKTTV